MGASRVRLIRQLVTESMLIALAGGALGLAVAGSGLGSLLAMAPSSLLRLSDIRLDGWIFAFTFLISIVTGAVFGIAPALYATKTNPSEALKEGEGRASAGAGRARLRQGLVIGELALSLVLLTGAGLMIATFEKLLNTNPGFDPHHVLTMQFWMTGSIQLHSGNHAVLPRHRATHRSSARGDRCGRRCGGAARRARGEN